jgi:hypothetical protein
MIVILCARLKDLRPLVPVALLTSASQLTPLLDWAGMALSNDIYHPLLKLDDISIGGLVGVVLGMIIGAWLNKDDRRIGARFWGGMVGFLGVVVAFFWTWFQEGWDFERLLTGGAADLTLGIARFAGALVAVVACIFVFRGVRLHRSGEAEADAEVDEVEEADSE